MEGFKACGLLLTSDQSDNGERVTNSPLNADLLKLINEMGLNFNTSGA